MNAKKLIQENAYKINKKQKTINNKNKTETKTLI